MSSATIKIFLVHGYPKRLRTAEISNWIGKAVAAPRSEFEGVICREEAESSGIYFLTSSEPETGKPSIYIGDAECIRDRLKSHLQKDFWNQAAYFVSKDENLTKAHIRHLEGKLIEQAREVGRAVVINSQSSGARLPESDRADLEIFLEKVNQLLPVLGIELLVPTAAKPEAELKEEMLTCEIRGVKARGHLAPNGFVILSGSQAVLNERPSAQKYPWSLNMRSRLKDEGSLSIGSDSLIFTRDVEFARASAASAVFHGGHANWLAAWKDSEDRTLKQIEAVQHSDAEDGRSDYIDHHRHFPASELESWAAWRAYE
ncbi:GIY-YIG nuclease family protein [Aphanothece minutissima]|uniref:DUF4357 domain-containing protein n=1 Tax=Aphanothece cf. minutissima CCALA 015 TaxID=2107695 RepID=A0ABX5F944_9CHRO|nr:GIY-YIG nuclease family protein [Aphanothece minutissima]PSB38163.1 DUF4357 domain-containing protein [Aphanothece cf. minutissima CCALA 015]